METRIQLSSYTIPNSYQLKAKCYTLSHQTSVAVLLLQTHTVHQCFNSTKVFWCNQTFGLMLSWLPTVGTSVFLFNSVWSPCFVLDMIASSQSVQCYLLTYHCYKSTAIIIHLNVEITNCQHQSTTLQMTCTYAHTHMHSFCFTGLLFNDHHEVKMCVRSSTHLRMNMPQN